MDLRTAAFGFRFLRDRLTGRHTPFLVQLTLLNNCNMRCNYCYAEFFQRGGPALELSGVRQILDDLADRGAFRINLVGGEPLLRKDIDQIVEHGLRRRLVMAMNTNGALVRKKIDVIRRLDSVCISLDGDECANDLNRGPGTFARAMDGVDSCLEAGIAVSYSSVLTRHSWDQVDYMVALARRSRGFVDFTTLISQERPGVSERERDDLSPSRSQLDAALNRIIELRKRGESIGFSLAAYQQVLAWRDMRVPFLAGRDPSGARLACHAGRDYVFIDASGDLYPCPQLVGLVPASNIIRDGSDEALRVAAAHNCRACPQVCTIDLNLFFSGDPRVLVSKLRQGRGAAR